MSTTQADDINVVFEALPQELVARDQWVLWKMAPRNGVMTKTPFQADGAKAKTDDPTTWSSFDIVAGVYRRHPDKWLGIGYVFAIDDPYIGIDLDACLDPSTGVVTGWAREVLDAIPSYTEVSPSGNGLKIFARVDQFEWPLPPNDKGEGGTGRTFNKGLSPIAEVDGKNPEIAFWQRRRFFTLTGNVFEGRGSMESCDHGIEAIMRQRWPKIFAAPLLSRASVDSLPSGDTDVVVGAMLRRTANQADTNDGSKRLYTVCCVAKEHNLTVDAALAAIRKYEQQRPFPVSYSDDNIRKRISDVDARAEVERGAALVQKRPMTDLGNAERIVDRYGDQLRYVEAWRQWFVWNGSRWVEDTTGEVHRLAQRVVRGIYNEARDADDADRAKAIAKWAAASESKTRLDAAVALAARQNPIAISHESLDNDAWLLNSDNGTIDLRSGVLRPADQGDLITKTTGVEYPTDPGVDSPVWDEFLTTIFAGDVELIRFVQRLLGAALVGEQIEHLLTIFHGSGANGKSVLIRAVLNALGEYGMIGTPNLLVESRGERHLTELCDLHKRRLVVVSETNNDAKLDEALVKKTTGGEPIRARRCHKDTFQFEASHMPIVVTNHKPVIRGEDDGIWRRLRLIPFSVTIPPDKQDKRLPDKLKREAPQILRWMVAGCMEWQRIGLAEPSSVLLATKKYQDDSDAIKQWMTDRCAIDPAAECKASLAFADYRIWCDSAGERAMTNRRFGERLGEQFTRSARRRDGFHYQGFTLSQLSATKNP